MPLISGPKNSRYTFIGKPCPHDDLAIKSHARTIGEALRQYESTFSVSIRACDEALPGQDEVKYFEVTDSAGLTYLVDIHVFRAGAEICPKQDLDFPLERDDRVELGQLVC